MNKFIKKNGKYYRINSDNTQTEVQLRDDYFHWTQSDGIKVKAKLDNNLTDMDKSESFLSKLGRVFTNATMSAANADAPAVTTASGWNRNPDGSWDQSKVDSEGAKQLRRNLAAISATAYTPVILAAAPLAAPGTALGTSIGGGAGTMALGMALEEGQRAVAGQSTGDIISDKLQSYGVHPLMADMARPEYYINPTGAAAKAAWNAGESAVKGAKSLVPKRRIQLPKGHRLKDAVVTRIMLEDAIKTNGLDFQEVGDVLRIPIGKDKFVMLIDNPKSGLLKLQYQGKGIPTQIKEDLTYSSVRQILQTLRTKNPYFIVTPREAAASDLLANIGKMTGNEQVAFFKNNIDNSFNLMHQRGLNGGYDRLRKNQQVMLSKYNDRDRRIIQNYIDAQIDPKYQTADGAFDELKWMHDGVPFKDHMRALQLAINDPRFRGFANLTEEGIKRAYNRPIETLGEYNANAAWNMKSKKYLQGYDRSFETLPRTNAHEKHHAVATIPVDDVPYNFKDNGFLNEEYLFKEVEGSEALARLSQIYNWYGITDGNRGINPIEFQWAAQNYLNTPYEPHNYLGTSYKHMDNNMQDMFAIINRYEPYRTNYEHANVEEFLKWAVPSTLAITPFLNNGRESDKFTKPTN